MDVRGRGFDGGGFGDVGRRWFYGGWFWDVRGRWFDSGGFVGRRGFWRFWGFVRRRLGGFRGVMGRFVVGRMFGFRGRRVRWGFVTITSESVQKRREVEEEEEEKGNGGELHPHLFCSFYLGFCEVIW